MSSQSTYGIIKPVNQDQRIIKQVTQDRGRVHSCISRSGDCKNQVTRTAEGYTAVSADREGNKERSKGEVIADLSNSEHHRSARDVQLGK